MSGLVPVFYTHLNAVAISKTSLCIPCDTSVNHEASLRSPDIPLTKKGHNPQK